MQMLKNDLSLQNITGSVKQNSSTKLKNIYSNNGIGPGGIQSDKNALYQ